MYRGTFGDRGTVGTEEQWAWRNSRHRGIQRNHKGTVGTEEQCAQRNFRHRATDEQLGTEEQST